MRSLLSTPAALVMIISCALPVLAGEGEPAGDPAYYALQPSIVSNLAGGPKYIRCDIQLMTRNVAEIPKIDLHAPALRHAMLLLMSGRDGSTLLTREGKEALRQSALQAVQAQLEKLTGDPIVSDLFFTAYYVK